jgi:hypothetical protein
VRTTRETLAAASAVASLELDGFALPLLLRVAGTQASRDDIRADNLET